MPDNSLISRLARVFRGASGPTASNDPSTLPFALPEAHLQAKARFQRALEQSRRAGAAPPLRGPGAERIRAARAIIRRLARRPPPSGGVPAEVATRLATIQRGTGAKAVVRTPALIATDVHLHAPPRAMSELSPELVGLMKLAADARRRREELEPLFKRIASGKASAEERTRYRHFVSAATEMLETRQAQRLLDREAKAPAPGPLPGGPIG